MYSIVLILKVMNSLANQRFSHHTNVSKMWIFIFFIWFFMIALIVFDIVEMLYKCMRQKQKFVLYFK